MRRVLCLSKDVGNEIRAPGLMPSFHTIVEELILNSLDAGSTSIHIKCDLIKFDVDVLDNGPGISQDDLQAGGLLGQWHASSKGENFTSFGFRGEAIAAISHLSDLTVTSKANGMSTLSRKICKGANCCRAEIDPFTGVLSGTLCRAQNIFGKLPVRQRNIKPAIEVSRLKQFVEKMSVLHHGVQWTFEITGQYAPVIQLPSAPSVASRFLALASMDVLSKMVSVDVEYDGMRILGLMTPPLPELCHCSNEFQYFYLEYRWMRGKDFVSQTIHKLFSEYMQKVSGYSVNARGPNPKHAMTGAHAPLHPTYILQLLCMDPAKEYDLLAEPDKTVATFRDPMRIYMVVDAMLKTISQNLYSKSFENDIPPEHKLENNTFGNTSSKAAYTIRETSVATLPTSLNSNFRLSFLQSPTNDRAGPSGYDFSEGEISDQGPVSLDILNEVISQPNNTLADAANFAMFYHQDKVNTDEVSPEIPYDLTMFVCESSRDPFEEAFLASPTSKDLEINTPREELNGLASLQFSDSLRQHHLRERNSSAVLTKLSLQNSCTVVGQADKKFIILRIGNFLVAADQHAVDERVRLEQLYSRLSRPTSVVSMQVPAKVLFVGSLGISMARDKSGILTGWGFTYTFCDNPNCLKLNSVPVINGEPLTEADFVEFLHLLERDIGLLPDELCKPPAVSRIFASHACRSAIKFGDKISLKRCRSLISGLAVTDMPFQCAHGRVSMSPLLDLKTLHASSKVVTPGIKRREMNADGNRTKPRYEHLYEL